MRSWMNHEKTRDYILDVGGGMVTKERTLLAPKMLRKVAASLFVVYDEFSGHFRA